MTHTETFTPMATPTTAVESVQQLATVMAHNQRALQQMVGDAQGKPWFMRPSRSRILGLSALIIDEIQRHTRMAMGCNSALASACDALKQENARLNQQIRGLMPPECDEGATGSE